MERKRRPYSTGDATLDARVQEMVEQMSLRDSDLVFEIIATAIRLGRDEATRLDRKIVNSALKEMRYAYRVFAPYRDVRKVSMFGSARTPADEPEYQTSREFAKRIVDRDWMVVSGAGPGIMEAANEGAGAAKSFGVNIRLPFEAKANPSIADDPKLINFKYFFTRKLMFIKEGDAFVLLPGGFGTLDELFELLTLVQTGKSDPHPIVLLDKPGGTYWKGWDSFVREHLISRGLISADDLNIYRLTDSIDEAVDELVTFYRNYHSIRFHGRTLILRVQRVPDEESLAALSRDFSDILRDGQITPTEPLKEEIRDDDALTLKRLQVPFDQMSYGRLRTLIDRLNEF
ncbi:MAG TPA: TIGR00730 family Rossman fold protein [Actinomycetota bacterium]|nr:TIGR00730 family Rossman fold protein [Actinomycetota bacterium]